MDKGTRVQIQSVPSHLEDSDVEVGQMGTVIGHRNSATEYMLELDERAWPVSVYAHNVREVQNG